MNSFPPTDSCLINMLVFVYLYFCVILLVFKIYWIVLEIISKTIHKVFIYLFFIFNLTQYCHRSIKYYGHDSITFYCVFHIPHSSQIMPNFIFSFPIYYLHRFAYLLKFYFITHQLKTLFFWFFWCKLI